MSAAVMSDPAVIFARLVRQIERDNEREVRRLLALWWQPDWCLCQLQCWGCKVRVDFVVLLEGRVWSWARRLAGKHAEGCRYAELDVLVADSERDLTVPRGSIVVLTA